MWITTKDGRKVNTDWFDKDRQISENEKIAKDKNTEDKEKVLDSLRKKLKKKGYRTYRGILENSGESVIMVPNGQMADGSTTYVRGDSKEVSGLEKDGYIRQYQKDKNNKFYLMTEDKRSY